jgi:hypothetical protein
MWLNWHGRPDPIAHMCRYGRVQMERIPVHRGLSKGLANAEPHCVRGSLPPEPHAGRGKTGGPAIGFQGEGRRRSRDNDQGPDEHHDASVD